ncbi:hypothetical protein [Pseudomonas entomophila]|uniref:hypothetical protein n=1 Tax=Pseudomonas entomophila TaxID=312306 RepID=UPI0015E36028|nr:hypothetical protein [Pseudomonas entomophila]
MFALRYHDGSRMELPAPDLGEAMRALVREGAASLEIEGEPMRVLERSVAVAELGLSRPGLLDTYSANWQPPTTDEFREAMRVGKLTGSTAGRLLGVRPEKIRKWAGGNGNDIPYAVWRILTVYCRLVAPDFAEASER